MRFGAKATLLGFLLFPLIVLSATAQKPGVSPSPNVLHTGTSLVLVDVIAEETKEALHSRELLTNLQKRDFLVFDNGHQVSLESFDSGSEHTTQPIALWLIALCTLSGASPEQTSGFLKGKTQLLLPALSHLNDQDAIGVAHWCDNGEASVDLTPQSDPAAALTSLDGLLNQKAIAGKNRTGELAMQSMIEQILAATKKSAQPRLPIFAFFYGDHSATYPAEADRILEDLLERSGIVYGLDEEAMDYNPDPGLRNGQVWELVHMYSSATGGEFYSVQRPQLFSSALAYILAQTHNRFVLGFKPPVRDGKRHRLRVELTGEAQHRYSKPVLRFRPEYVPSPAISSGGN